MVDSIDIGGYTPEDVFDVNTHATGGDDLGRARLLMSDSSSNRDNISAGDNVTITYSNSDWTGYITAEQKIDEPNLYEVRALETRLELKHEQLHQVFYDVARSDAVTTAVTERAQPLSLYEVHTGDDLTNWTSNAPEFQLYTGTRAGLYNWGTDLLVLGVRSGWNGTVQATYDYIISDAIEDGIFELRTRILVPDPADIWQTEIELVTPDGTTYVWTPEVEGTSFQSLVLKAEEATTDGILDETGVLQYRFTPNATLANNTAILIDNAHTLPFRRLSRSTAIGTSEVETTDDSIIRRADEPAGRFIDDLAVEAGYSWWVDDSDTLYFKEKGRAMANRNIEAGTTQVVGVDAERDYESVRNVVTVQGAGDVEVTVSNQRSIAFYGPNARSEPIVDRQLQSEDAARERAEGFLENNAFDDAAVTFKIANSDYLDLRPEDQIDVTWSDLGLDGTYTVSRISSDTGNIVNVTISVTTA